MAQTPAQHYLLQLLERIEKGEIDPFFVTTHRATLEEGPDLYRTFRDKRDGRLAGALASFAFALYRACMTSRPHSTSPRPTIV